MISFLTVLKKGRFFGVDLGLGFRVYGIIAWRSSGWLLGL